MLAGLAGVAVIAAFWFVLLAPKREEIARLDGEIAQARQVLAAATVEVAAAQQARAGYARDYATVAALGKVVPADDDMASLIFQLQGTARRRQVGFELVSVSDATTPEAASAAATPAGAGGLRPLAVTFRFTGRYHRLRTFVRDVRDFVRATSAGYRVRGRLLTIDTIKLTGVGSLSAEVGATVYVATPPPVTPSPPSVDAATPVPPSTSATPLTAAAVTPPTP